MTEKKDKQKISDIFFGKAEEVFTNVRLFLHFKKTVKIVGNEIKSVEDARKKIAKLYGGSSSRNFDETTKSGETKKVETDANGGSISIGEAESPSSMVFIPLSEIAKNSIYSKNYINFSARQGKMKAEKINGVWHTTEEWLAEFTKKSQEKKKKFKEKLSKDHGGSKKFVEEIAEKVEIGSSASIVKAELPGKAARGEEFGSFPALKAELEREMIEKKKAREKLKKKLRRAVASREVILQARKFSTKTWDSVKAWVCDLGKMEGAKEIAKLRKVRLADFWKFDFAKSAAAIISLVLLMAVGNITKADLGYWGDMGKKKAYVAYNESVDGVARVAGVASKSVAKQIAKVKVGKEKFVKIADDILRREKIGEFESNSKLSLHSGSDEQKGVVAGMESDENGGSTSIGEVEPPTGGRVLAATGAALMNVGDIEVSAYLMDGLDKEIPNGEYDVRFGIYTADRTEADPYPSDTDKGTRVWEETQKVVVENGLLKTYLGATTPIPANFNFAASNYFIGIRVAEDAEMVPRKRIGAVPLARTAMSVAGQTIGNGTGNIPLSNGTLNVNLNADLLDGKHATAFQPAGSYQEAGDYQPAGDYDNYLNWNLAASDADSGQAISTGEKAIVAGENGIVTARNLNTLTISPTYGAADNTIAEGSTVITVNTDGNLQGGGSGTAGGGISLILDTVDNPIFNTVFLSTLDLGTNTITDGNLNGNWNFNNGIVQGIDALTATTGNFTIANITTGNITTADLGTNTITDGNLTGDWDFNAGTLSNITGATVTGNFNLTGASNLIFGGATSLAESTGPLDSGAYLVGANDEFTNSTSTNVQGVLADLDAAITGGGPGALWTLAGGTVFPTNPAHNFAVNGTNFFVDAATGAVTANGDFEFTGNQSITGTGTITVNPTGNLYLQSSSYFMDESGNLTVAKVIAPEMEYSGNITIDANSAAGTTTITVVNQDGAQVANLQIEGDIDVQGGKITLATGETIDAETADTVKINSNGDIIAILGDAAGAKKFAVYDSTGASEVGHIDSNGNIQMDGTATFADKLTVESNGASITGDVVIVGDIDATTGTITTLDGTTLTYGTGNFTTLDLGTNTIYDGNLTGNWNFNAGNLTNITALTAGTVNATTIDLGTNTITDTNFNGNWNFNSSALTGISSIDTINVSGTALTFTGTAPTISVSTAATNINLEAGTTGEINIGSVSSGNVNIASQGTGDIILAGGSSLTGCTIDNATGNLDCSGNITGSSSGTIGFWTRAAANLTPATAGDDVYLPTNSLLGVGYDPAAIFGGVAAFNGNVGIGTTAPGAKLEILDASNPQLRLTQASGASYADFQVDSAGGLTIATSAGVTSQWLKMDGNYNFLFGDGAGYSNTGQFNYVFGENAGYQNAGDSNYLIGNSAGYDNNSDSEDNYFFGLGAGYENVGDMNYFIGEGAGYSNVGDNNYFFGSTAGYTNTGSNNTFIGDSAGYANSGSYNLFIGDSAGYNNTADGNLFIGDNAGWSNTSGNQNILIGYNAGWSLETGSNNIILGYNQDSPAADTTNFLNIGGAIFGNLSNGNVGIGATNPLAKLDVRGALYAGTNGTEFQVSTGGNVTAGTYNGITITSGTGTLTLNTKTLTLNNSLAFTGADSKTINFGTNNLSFSTSGDYTLTIPQTGTAALGTGTNNYITRWTGTNTLSTGTIYDNGTNVGIGTTDVGTYKLNVGGSVNATGYYVSGTPLSPTIAGTLTGETLYWNGAAWTASTNLFNNNTNVGIGTTAPGARFSIKGSNSEGTLGTEKVTNGSFTGNANGWSMFGGFSYNSNNVIHTPGSSGILSQNFSNGLYERYLMIFTIASRTAGSVRVQVGHSSPSGSFYQNGTHSINIATSFLDMGVMLLSSDDFDGTIDDVSVKKITAADTALSLINNNGSPGPEMRSGGSWLFNTFTGLYSGYSNVSGFDNTAYGYSALNSNVAGNHNTAVGSGALYANTNGSNNIAIGYAANASSITGSYNVAIGSNSIQYNQFGSANTVLGDSAGQGSYSNSSLQNDTFIGYQSGYSALTTGDNNTYLGYQSGYTGTTGANNLVLGYQAGYLNSTGSSNVFLGYKAGYSETGSNKLYIANSDTTSLIYGDFSTGAVGIGGTVAHTNPHLTILAAGNVGIGTTNPLAKLDVRGAIYAGTNGTEFQVSTGGNVTAGTYNGITITTGTGTLTLNTKTLTLNNSLSFTGADSKTINFGTNNLTFSTAGDYTLTIPATGTAALGTGTNNYITRWTGTNTLSTGTIYDNGTNVGIGTTDVGTYKLNVGGTVNATSYYVSGTPLATTTAGTYNGQTLYWNSGSSAWTASTNLFNNNTNVGIGTTLPSQLFQVNNSGSNPVVITSGGNLGIGITSPTQKLHIVGSGLFTAGIYIGSDADTNALIDDSSNGAGSTTLYIGNRAIATAGSGGTIFGTENYISKFGSGGTSIGNSQIYDNGTSVGIGTTNLSGVKFKIANDESSVSDTYDDQSKIAGASDATVSGGQVKVSETTCGTYSVQDADGNSYDTVLIGSRCWMASNLNVGDPVCTIGGNEDGDGNDDTCTKNMSDDANIEKYCYLNNAANCAAKGGLYQWDEAMQYSETVPRQGICPANWHIPTDAEWKTAEMAIGMSQEQADLTGWRGTTEGDELKDSGLCGGRTPCDTSGFNGLLAGYRFSGGSFYDLGYVENSWSSSVSGGDAWSRGLFLYEARVYRYLFDQAYGFSVRCVKD